MPKKPVSFRFTPETEGALRRLVESSGAQSVNDALEESIRGWGRTIALAGQQVCEEFSAREWCLMADVLNGTLTDPSWTSPGVLLAAEVSDAHRLNGTGYRWLAEGERTELDASLCRTGLASATAGTRACDSAVQSLVERLAALDHARAWAMLYAIRWFWAHPDVDAQADPWWLPAWQQQHDRQSEGK